jgi:RNA polymerase sigma-70 factor (ECF subfamily)
LDDKCIIEGLRKGNEKALKMLYDKFFPSLCSYAFKIIKEEMPAGDIVQEIYTKELL